MISKEEALRWAIDEDYSAGKTTHVEMIISIYNSIGTCGECIHWAKDSCTMTEVEALYASEYCSRFERNIK